MGVPQLMSLQPAGARVNDPQLTMHCIGTGFEDGCVIVWNGGDEPTTFINSGDVTTGVNPTTVWEGISGLDDAIPVQIRNPGGELSNTKQFVFLREQVLMPAVTYAATLRPGVEGAMANEEPVDLISRTVEDAAGIGFGKAVVQGINDNGCKIAGATGKVLGITVRERSVRVSALSGNGFAQYDTARIMNQGVIWVKVGSAVVAGNAVAWTSATGLWGATGDIVITDARFETSAGANGIAQVRLGNLHG